MFSETKCIYPVILCTTGVNQPNVEVAIAKIMIGLVGTWLIAWTPYSLIALLGVSGHGYLVTPLNSMLPALFAKLAACVNPFIYSLNHPKIRQEILFRLYNSFFLSMGRRGGWDNSDSMPHPEWKTSAARYSNNRMALLNATLVQQPGRVGSSLASFHRANKFELPTPASGGPTGGSAGGRGEARLSLSLSSAESRTEQSKELDVAVILAQMMAQANRQLDPLMSSNETEDHVHINLVHLHDNDISFDVEEKIDVTADIKSLSSTF